MRLERKIIGQSMKKIKKSLGAHFFLLYANLIVGFMSYSYFHRAGEK